MEEGYQYDCIIVGAGIEGSCSARYAASMGKKTLCLEQFPLPHDRGSSHGQSRIYRCSYVDYSYAVLMPEALTVWEEIEEQAKEKLMVRCGCLTIDKAPYNYMNAISKNLKTLGITVEVVTAKQLCEKYKLCYPDDHMGIFEHTAGILRANKCLRAIQQQFVEFGGTLQDEEKVLEIIPGESVKVKTNKGEYKSDTIILTPGPWAQSLLKPLGINIGLQARRLTTYYWKVKEDGFRAEDNNYPVLMHSTNLCDPISGKASKLFYFIPCLEYPDLVKFCNHVPVDVDPDERDKFENTLAEKRVSDYIKQHILGVDGEKACIKEHCIETASPDSLCTLDVHPKYKNIAFAVGFEGSGFKKAPVIGKILYQLVFGLKPSYDLNHFKLDRFQTSAEHK